MGKPEAAGARRHDTRHRSVDRESEARRSDSGESARRGRRRLPVLLWSAGRAPCSRSGARRGGRTPARLSNRTRGPARRMKLPVLTADDKLAEIKRLYYTT